MEDSWPLTPVLAHGVPQGSILVYILSYIMVGKAFSENSYLTYNGLRFDAAIFSKSLPNIGEGWGSSC